MWRSPAGAGAHVDANQSGTTARFAVPLAALGEVPVVVDAHPQMRGRPMGDQFAALRSMGVTITELGEPDRLPARITGPIDGAETSLPGDTSSQFITGLLLAGGASSMQVALTTEPISRPYIEMTGAVMRSFGAAVDDDGDRRWRVGGGYVGTDYRIDRCLCCVVLSGRSCDHRRSGSYRRARAKAPGRCCVRRGARGHGLPCRPWPHHVEVSGRASRGRGRSERYLRHRADAAVVAAFADSPTRVDGIGFIRDKESDRVAGPVTELRRPASMRRNTTTALHPPAGCRARHLRHLRRSPNGDGVLARRARRPGVEISDPGCVAKTFPGFFQALDQLR